MDELAQIKQSYADVVRAFKDKVTTQMVLSEIQDALNDNARKIYDKFGRIIIKVGPDADDYLDITSPRASFQTDTVCVDFTQTTSNGVPIESFQ
jgi:ABC-type uncharacterized transport system ATPase component